MLLPWLAWNLVNFGTIMQSSGLAVPFFAMKKYDVIYSPFGKTWHLLIEMLKNVLRPWLFAAVGIPLLALAVAWRGHRRDQRIQLIVLVSIGSALLLTVHSLFRGFIREWYVLMQIPLILIVFAVAAAVFAERFPIRCGGRRRFAIAVVVLLIPLALKQPYLSQKLTVDHGVPLVAELTKQHRVAALNSGYYGYFSSRPGSVVNLDGVVNFNAYEAIKQGNIRQLMNHDSVDYVLDLAGDLGGYKGLIDHHMLSDFTFDTAYHVPSLTEELALYRRTGR
jgi:hypothetical protein